MKKSVLIRYIKQRNVYFIFVELQLLSLVFVVVNS